MGDESKAGKTKIVMAKLGQLAGNPLLDLGVTQDGVRLTKITLGEFGSVCPLVVKLDSNGLYQALNGPCDVKAMRDMVVQDVPVVIVDVSSEEKEVLLTLMLSMRSSEPGPIAQGILIGILTGEKFNYSLEHLSRLLRVSRPWLSKRQSMARNLTEEVKALVVGGVLPARSAEEVAKLPPESQFVFAKKGVECGLSKDTFAKLVALHNNKGTAPEIKQMILSNQLGVDMGKPDKKTPVRAKPGAERELDSLMRFATSANRTTAKRLGDLDWKRDGVPPKRRLEELRDSAKSLVGLVERILDIMSESAGHGATPGAGTFPRGNAQGGGRK